MSMPEIDPIPEKQAMRDTAVSPQGAYTYTYYATPEPSRLEAYEPLPHQIERATRNKRSTRWHLFPIAVAGILAIIFSIFLLYQAIWPSTPNARAFLSGMADFTLIMFMLPLILVFLLVQIGMAALGFHLIQRKRTMPESTAKTYGTLRVLLWQIEHWLEQARPYVDKATNKATALTIRYNQKMAAIEAWLTTLKQWIIRR